MQYLHALKLGCDSRLDKLADAWMRGEVKPGQLNKMIEHTESEHRKKLDNHKEQQRIALIQQQEEEETDDELLALFAAIEEIQDANLERVGYNKNKH
ncbi:hypothetical protein QUC26_09265 [Pseudomonas asiatica]|uniref:hypothetical protein n=1 Tax=Pseudomonas asiatica TaxID=2219225 RepID=UPI0025A1EA03|nr:hypothetical protein [Pseudomonas asiatica]WJM55317.1 hypothetical protein QUC26_09265 [Pseudomonas asiatica]